MGKRLITVMMLLLTACAQTPSPTQVIPTNSSESDEVTGAATQDLDLGTYEPQQIQIELADTEPFDIQPPSVQYFDGIGSLYLDRGIYYALVGGYDPDTDYYYVYQAVSQDGLEWVFNESDLTSHDLYEGGGCVPRQLIRPDDREWVYFVQCNEGTMAEDPAYILHITAPEFTGPWTWYSEPVLGGNSEEDRPVWFLNITPLPSGYRMYVYFPVDSRIGIADSDDGYSWDLLTQESQEPEEVFSLQDLEGNPIFPRRIEAVWLEGERWYMIYLLPAPTDASMETYTPSYRLAAGPDGFHWVSIGEVALPDEEIEGPAIITSLIPTENELVATLCRWADQGGMTCYLGEADRPVGLNE